MVAARRIGLVLGVVVLALAAYGAWYVYGAWPVPEGWEFPRHSLWGSGPAALFEGQLVHDDGCIMTQAGATVVWPPGYSLSVEEGEPIVHGSGREVRTGEPVRMGGGWYESGDPPPTTFDLGACPAPYFLSTGFVPD
jgi:hypothetical protein